ncbi:PspC domain-containing protein [Lentilactobacillus sp. SPB1-3]|uniref:PspC domain-containing protein n=1 Tax=Lentilactobacillus terminaliae TaxID=3003483 RepID=A0ACD5DGF8_9LACO|nr:PspC domain-containing protein [Lentilactobacillus sp. SPB1-3]MCZ0976950.1 PspC domain-containing protein [Lentilactobacillus sp. SPB1-3]
MKWLNTIKRSTTDRWVAGVLGGISQSLNWNSTLVRVLFLVLLFVPIINIIIIVGYIAAVIIMPTDGSTGSFFDLFKGFNQKQPDNSRKVIHSVEEHDVDDNKGE